jgi:O-antigen/teichoic acid export membrane protein
MSGPAESSAGLPAASSGAGPAEAATAARGGARRAPAASLSEKAGFLIVANFVKYAIGFMMPMILVRLLTRSDYGTYQQLLLVGAVCTTLFTFGIPVSVYYFHRQADAGREAMLRLQSSGILGTAALLAFVLVVPFAPQIAARMDNPQVASLLPVYFIGVALAIANEHFVPFMIAEDRYGVAVGFETVEAALRIPLLVLPLWLGYGLTGLAWALTAFAAVRFAIRTFVLFGRGQLRGLREDPAGARPFLREQFAYSAPLALTALVGLALGMLDRALIAMNFTPAQFATYAVGAIEIPLDVIFQGAVANVVRAAIPGLIREGRTAEIAPMLREAVRKLSLVVLPSFVFLFGHADAFITLLFTDTYADSVAVFRIYLLLVPLHVFVLSAVPQAYGKTRWNLTIVAFVSVVHIVLSFVLLKTIGFFGPAISTVFCAWLQSTLFVGAVRRLTGAPLRRLFPLPEALRVGVAAGVALLASMAVDASMAAGWLRFIAAGAVFSAVFALAAIAVRAVSTQDLALARRWAQRVLPLPRRGR